SCFQKDVLNLVYLCGHFGLPEVAEYWESVITMNQWQKRRFADSVVQAFFNTVSDKRLAVLGFAFKKDTNDTRETPAIEVCKRLLEERASLAIYDPKVETDKIHRDLDLEEGDEHIEICSSADTAVAGANAILVITEWDEFKELDFEALYESMVKPAWIFDGRNLLDHGKLREIGFKVRAIGKPIE
ncbi:MAG: UDP binding domain-containing protein, partial [Verrucomicrobiota bacterium]